MAPPWIQAPRGTRSERYPCLAVVDLDGDRIESGDVASEDDIDSRGDVLDGHEDAGSLQVPVGKAVASRLAIRERAGRNLWAAAEPGDGGGRAEAGETGEVRLELPPGEPPDLGRPQLSRAKERAGAARAPQSAHLLRGEEAAGGAAGRLQDPEGLRLQRSDRNDAPALDRRDYLSASPFRVPLRPRAAP
jgi:hypothetical protein